MKHSDFMQESYRLMYQIEISLKSQIRDSMKSHYGKHWKYKLNSTDNFPNVLFHQLIPYFAKYKPLNHLYTDNERKELYNLILIRNKICHMELINQEQFDLLSQAHSLVLSKSKTSLVKN